MEKQTDVLIIGAGLAGLTAAKAFKSAGLSIKILEASDGVDGHVRTDEVNGIRPGIPGIANGISRNQMVPGL